MHLILLCYALHQTVKIFLTYKDEIAKFDPSIYDYKEIDYFSHSLYQKQGFSFKRSCSLVKLYEKFPFPYKKRKHIVLQSCYLDLEKKRFHIIQKPYFGDNEESENELIEFNFKYRCFDYIDENTTLYTELNIFDLNGSKGIFGVNSENNIKKLTKHRGLNLKKNLIELIKKRKKENNNKFISVETEKDKLEKDLMGKMILEAYETVN
ncbi:hypothetical protein AH06_02030 [candidate division TM6 bacterium Zodletone_IIa]|nr:hypothetical protein AH06_02030 [candidate division TM6 bacterium Zodletone_IIa]